MLKRSAAIVSALIVFSLLASSETFAFNRCGRDGYRRAVATTYYSPYAYRGFAGQRYYSQSYYSQPYYSQRYYSQPYYSGVAGSRYYRPYYRGHSTRNLVLSVVAPAAVGAGIGAIAGGGKGAGIGAAIGGGGGALFYLLRHHGRRY